MTDHEDLNFSTNQIWATKEIVEHVFLSLYWIYYNIHSLFYIFIFLTVEVLGILFPDAGIEPTPAAWEGEVLTTGFVGP